MAKRIPYIGGSKSKETAILRFNRMKPMKRGKLLQLPAVKSKKTIKGKYRAVIQILEKKNKRRRR